MALKTNYEKNGAAYFRLTATIGRDVNGKLIRKEFYGKSKKEAEKQRDEYINGLNSGLNVDYKDVTLGKLMHLWLFEIIYISNRIKPSTFQRYEGIYRNYVEKSELYSIRLSDLKSIQLQRYYNKLYCSGKSSGCVKTLNKLLKTFFNYALEEGYILKNPCIGRKIVIPGNSEAEKKEVTVFNEEEIIQLRTHLKGHRMECLILMALGTGLRQGELLGLKWSDIDFNRNELHVERTLKNLNVINADRSREYKHILQAPKSKSSMRTVPIPSSLIPTLKAHRKNQLEEKLRAGSSYDDSNFIFSTEIGNSIDARNLTRGYKRLLIRANIPYRKFHSLRHTYATKLFEENIPLKTIQTLLGHSDISITANIYTHVMPKERIEAVETLNRLFV